ncbi:MAG TPA: M23 family metallopeptidase [Candidatus Eisenbacteria bacterium]|nr:M23 family metallopeptidase [Candidatus Eisenbacteria bacterium]
MILRHQLCVATLLFPALMFAQAAAPAPKPASPTPAASGGSYPVMSASAKSRCRQLFGDFESGQSAALYAAFSQQMKKPGSSTQLATLSKKVGTELGREEKMLGENFAPDMIAANTIYSRFSKFSKAKDPIYTVIAINQQGEILLFQFRPSPPAPGNRYVDYKATTKLRLPFDGDWFVYEGGREIYQNSNAYRDAERYSVVFTVVKDGRTFSGDGTKNEQFYCYGQPVVAPADGTVVMINDSFADNAPGRSESVMPAGNRVLIYHGHKEYSLLMHLKQNSIKVKSGAKVKQGDVVGECGNSGKSPAPHLEYRLQNSRGVPLPYSLPAQFVDYVADGTAVASGEPVRGQHVHNSPAPPPPPAAPAGEQK